MERRQLNSLSISFIVIFTSEKPHQLVSQLEKVHTFFFKFC